MSGLEENVSERERRNVTHAMLGPNVLDTAQYPTATFTVTSIIPLDKQGPGKPGNYQVEGKLDFHGVSGPIRFQAKTDRTETKEAFRVRGQFAARPDPLRHHSLLGVIRHGQGERRAARLWRRDSRPKTGQVKLSFPRILPGELYSRCQTIGKCHWTPDVCLRKSPARPGPRFRRMNLKNVQFRPQQHATDVPRNRDSFCP